MKTKGEQMKEEIEQLETKAANVDAWMARALRAEKVAVLAIEHMEHTLQVYGDEQLALIDRAVAAEKVVEAARKLMMKSKLIGEEHPAYGFLVMGIPLAKAVAEYDAKRRRE